MDKDDETAKKALKPLRSLAPRDQGGVRARRGFAFQDHVAAKHSLEMLSGGGPEEVWCETYDDIVLVFKTPDGEEYEFVQVKDEHPPQLWTPSKLCEREKKAPGSSMLERSLARDECLEPTRFRIVTSRQIRHDLDVLSLPRDHRGRQPGNDRFDRLRSVVCDAIGSFASENGNGPEYWLLNAQWDVVGSAPDLEASNKLQLMRALPELGFDASPEVIDTVYIELLGYVKTAAEELNEYPEKKRISVASLKSLITITIDAHPTLRPNAKLKQKLTDAGLDPADIEAARELRRWYLEAIRSPKYLTSEDAREVPPGVLALLHRLRAQLNSGEIPPESIGFHALCLQEVREFAASGTVPDDVPLAFAEGCMYDITSRCQHRFVKAST